MKTHTLKLWLAMVVVSLLTTQHLSAEEPDDPQKTDTKVEQQVARQSLLDILPAEAAGSLGIRSINLLKKNGDTFIQKAGAPPTIRVSDLFAFAFSWVGLHNGINNDAPCYLTAVDMRKFGDFDKNPDESLVLVVPFVTLKAIASNYEGSLEDLEAGKVFAIPKRENQQWPNFGRFLKASKTHLYLGNHQSAVEFAAKTKPLRSSLSKAEAENLEKYDLVLQVGTKEWGRGWERTVKNLKRELADKDPSEEQKALMPLARLFLHLKTGIIAARIDGGLQLTGMALLEDDPAVKEIMTVLRSGPAGSTMNALPNRTLLSAQAVVGSGEKTAMIAKGVYQLMMGEIFWSRTIFSHKQTDQLVGLLGELWQRLDGVRMGLYQNQPSTEEGMVALLAVLDPHQADSFLTEMKELSQFVNQATKTPEDNDQLGVDEKEIAKLIKQLGAAGFKDRQSATTKLALLGKVALPQLKEALESSNREIQGRAKHLVHKIETTEAKDRKEVLNNNQLAKLKVKFGYVENAETRNKVRVDQLKLLMEDEQGDFKKSLSSVLGKDWQHVRIAQVGKQVVVMMGSRTDLFDQTIENLQKQQQGISDAPQLALFKERADPERKMEFHFAVQGIEKLTTNPSPEKIGETLKQRGKPFPLSSLSILLQPTTIQLDVILPFEELEYMVRKGGLFRFF